jgi:uncharacterized protein YaeQ
VALPSTIFKAELSISDLDRQYYVDHQLTLARHPSETDQRMMVRLLAFILYANERLLYSKGLCVDDEPALWQKGLSGDIELWMDVGLPDEKRVRKACQRSDQVVLLLYGGRSAELWCERNASKICRFDNLIVYEVSDGDSDNLLQVLKRSMKLQCTIQDGVVWMTGHDASISVTPLRRKD